MVRGFSLMELMIAVAVMAILTVIAYPSYNSYMASAKRAEAKAALLEAFGDIQRLRQADEALIAAVPGIGPRFAAIVRTHLDRMSGGG